MSRIYAAAIEHNTLLDADAPVQELIDLGRFGDTDDELFATPISGDALARKKHLGLAAARAQLLGWRTIK